MEEETYRLANWEPIWMDRGRTLVRLVEKMQSPEFDDEHWIVFATLLMYQTAEDLRLHALAQQLFNDLEGFDIE